MMLKRLKVDPSPAKRAVVKTQNSIISGSSIGNLWKPMETQGVVGSPRGTQALPSRMTCLSVVVRVLPSLRQAQSIAVADGAGGDHWTPTPAQGTRERNQWSVIMLVVDMDRIHCLLDADSHPFLPFSGFGVKRMSARCGNHRAIPWSSLSNAVYVRKFCRKAMHEMITCKNLSHLFGHV